MSVLIVEDDESLGKLIEKKLKRKGFRVDFTKDLEEARRLIRDNPYEIVLLDLKLKDGDGMELLKELAHEVSSKFIVITGFGDINTAVEAMKLGAVDFIQKPFSFDILEVSIEKAIREKRLEEENRRLKSFLFEKDHEITFETRSEKFKNVLQLVERASKSDVNVLLRGETGTGKEVIARYIHRLSSRRDKPFVVVDCTSIPEHLFESELFGHEKGAYTGANQRKLGLVEIANGGTLFLDEIGDIPLQVQAKLLRFVETRSFRRVGGLKEIKVDVRIISATNRNLEDMVRKGEFRSDLLFRINTVEIEIPPLRERKEDIPLLAQIFLKKFRKKVREDTLRLMMEYDWPGNIRELRNTIEKASILAKGEFVDSYICFPTEKHRKLKGVEAMFEDLPTLEDLEIRYIAYLYERFGNVDKVAEVLGCSRRTVFRKLRKLRERNNDSKGGSLTTHAVNFN